MSTIKPYNDKTWVGFLDICGFKNEMEKGNENARSMLNKFYNKVHEYKLLYNKRIPDFNTIELNVLSVSDCAIMFSRNNSRYESDKTNGLITILNFIKNLNRSLIKNPEPRIMTSCSIAYGNLFFESRNQGQGISKEFFYGDAYLNAYLDNSNLNNKLQPGDCRIIMNDHINLDSDIVFNYLKQERQYYYFYWMLNKVDNLNQFKNDYNIDVYELKKDVLNKYIDIR